MSSFNQMAKPEEGAGAERKPSGITRRAFMGALPYVVPPLVSYFGTKAAISGYNKIYGLSYEIEKITDVITRRLRSVPEDEILFVPMGEYHDQASHKIVTQGVIAQLKQRGIMTAVGMEYPYDSLPREVSQNYELPYLNDFERADFQLTPKKADDAAQTQSYLNARQAVRQFMKFMYMESIPFDFHDLKSVWRDGQKFLDTKDIRLKGAALRTKTLPQVTPDLTAVEPLGMYLRNEEMKSNAYSTAYMMLHDNIFQTRVYIQHCGAEHLIGSNENPFEQSLCHLMQKCGMYVLGVDLTGSMASPSPQARKFIEGGGLLSVTNVDRRSFDYTGLGEVATRKREIAESVYLKDLCAEAGVKCYMRPPEMGTLEIPKPGL